MSRIVDIQMTRLQKLLDDRKITITLDAERARMAGRQGLGSGLWRAAAEARDPEGGAGPARRDDPRRHRSRTARRSPSRPASRASPSTASWRRRRKPQHRSSPRKRGPRVDFDWTFDSRLRGMSGMLPRRRRARGHARGLARHDAVEPFALLLEARQHRTFQHAAARQLDAHRIDEAAVDAGFRSARASRSTGRSSRRSRSPGLAARACLRRCRARRRSCGRRRSRSRWCGGSGRICRSRDSQPAFSTVPLPEA